VKLLSENPSATLLSLLAAACITAQAAVAGDPGLAAPPDSTRSDFLVPDFLRDVRPLLARHCFKCHGPDEKSRKAGLRLDVREEALKPAESGERPIVPERPEESELVRRISTGEKGDLIGILDAYLTPCCA
jgi:hypothetical protein